MKSDALTLEEAAARLGLHYMTVYRYVRTGRLPAEWRDGRWHIRPGDLVLAARGRGAAGRGTRSMGQRGSRSLSGAADRMRDRLLAGDSSGAWNIVESALLAGGPGDVYLQVLGPCLRAIGEQWESGRISVADEHRATAVAMSLLGRLGPMFARRGRRRSGSVLLAGAEGDPHVIPVVMVGDLLRSGGFDVVQLGANVPADTLLAMAERLELTAVGLSASTEETAAEASRAIAELHARRPGVPVVLGGPAVLTEQAAMAAGADGWAADGLEAIGLMVRLEQEKHGQ